MPELADRWWSPEAQTRDEDLLSFTPGEEGLGGVLFAMHRRGARALRNIPFASLTEPDEVATYLEEVSPYPLLEAVSKSIPGEDGAHFLCDELDAADSAAEIVFRAAVTKGVAREQALDRAALVYGVPATELGPYLPLAIEPKTPPAKLIEQADRLLMAHVTEAATGALDSWISKATSAFDEAEHPRDARGEFTTATAVSTSTLSTDQLNALLNPTVAPEETPTLAPVTPVPTQQHRQVARVRNVARVRRVARPATTQPVQAKAIERKAVQRTSAERKAIQMSEQITPVQRAAIERSIQIGEEKASKAPRYTGPTMDFPVSAPMGRMSWLRLRQTEYPEGGISMGAIKELAGGKLYVSDEELHNDALSAMTGDPSRHGLGSLGLRAIDPYTTSQLTFFTPNVGADMADQKAEVQRQLAQEMARRDIAVGSKLNNEIIDRTQFYPMVDRSDGKFEYTGEWVALDTDRYGTPPVVYDVRLHGAQGSLESSGHGEDLQVNDAQRFVVGKLDDRQTYFDRETGGLIVPVNLYPKDEFLKADVATWNATATGRVHPKAANGEFTLLSDAQLNQLLNPTKAVVMKPTQVRNVAQVRRVAHPRRAVQRSAVQAAPVQRDAVQRLSPAVRRAAVTRMQGVVRQIVTAQSAENKTPLMHGLSDNSRYTVLDAQEFQDLMDGNSIFHNHVMGSRGGFDLDADGAQTVDYHAVNDGEDASHQMSRLTFQQLDMGGETSAEMDHQSFWLDPKDPDYEKFLGSELRRFMKDRPNIIGTEVRVHPELSSAALARHDIWVYSQSQAPEPLVLIQHADDWDPTKPSHLEFQGKFRSLDLPVDAHADETIGLANPDVLRYQVSNGAKYILGNDEDYHWDEDDTLFQSP